MKPGEQAGNRARGSGRRLGYVAVLVAAAMGLVFKLYEPLIVGPFGWAAMPNGAFPSTSRSSGGGLSEAAARADGWLEEARFNLGAPALSAAVSIDGEVVWAGAAGFADLERQLAATPESVFRIGSSSKAVTSVAMGTLLDRNAVDLDAPVSAYIPDLAEPLASVTTRQAMSHTAGVRDYGACLCFPALEYFNRKHYRSQRDALRPFESDELLFAAGEGFAYSSFGYNVAGAVIESVTGARFADFLHAAVFEPLGMEASRAETGEPAEGLAVFYDIARPGLFKEVFRVDNSNKLPSGGLLSTPSDLARLGYQMIQPTLFDEEARDALLPPGDAPPFYGLGWRYQAETEFLGSTTPRIHHHGTALGSTSHFTVYPEYGMVVSVMMNAGQRPGRGLEPHAHALAAIFAAQL